MKTQVSRGPPWNMLVMDFARNTTMHGVRFLVEPTKFLMRRFSGLTVVTSVIGPPQLTADI